MENEHRRKAVLFLLGILRKHLTKCNYKVKIKM